MTCIDHCFPSHTPAKMNESRKLTPRNCDPASEAHMRAAIEIAKASRARGGYGIGAVIVKNNTIISSGCTELDLGTDPTSHAEINAIRSGCRRMKTRFLDGCTLFSTFEPCPMCTSAAIWAKIDSIVFGAFMSDHTSRAHQRILIRARDVAQRGEPELQVHGGLLRDECLKLIN